MTLPNPAPDFPDPQTRNWRLLLLVGVLLMLFTTALRQAGDHPWEATHLHAQLEARAFARLLDRVGNDPVAFRRILSSKLVAGFEGQRQLQITQAGLPPATTVDALLASPILLLWPVNEKGDPWPLCRDCTQRTATPAEYIALREDERRGILRLEAPVPDYYPGRRDHLGAETYVELQRAAPGPGAMPDLFPLARAMALLLAADQRPSDLADFQQRTGTAFVREAWEALPEPVEALSLYATLPPADPHWPEFALIPIIAGQERSDRGYTAPHARPQALKLIWTSAFADDDIRWIDRGAIPHSPPSRP